MITLDFDLQNNSGSGDNPPVTFYNFSLAGVVATPVVTWSQPAAILYGTPLGSNQLNATANVPGNFAYTPANGTVLSVGTNTLSVIFTPSDTTDYTSATNTVSIVVLKATPAVTWPPPSAIIYGTALSSNQLDATANVPGSFAYNPMNGVVLNVGTNTLSVIFTPNDTVDYSSATNIVNLVVLTPQIQTAPIITLQPQSAVVVLAGSNLIISVNATGSPAPNYQWRFDGTNLDGQVLSSLSLTNMIENQSGSYDVMVSNAYGSVTSSVSRITVMTPTVYWTGAGDGQSWNDSSNWDTGELPTSSDSIFIGRTNGTITVSGGLTLGNLLCQCSLTLNGSLNVSGAVDIAQSFSLPAGSSISTGTNSMLIAEGSTTTNAVNIYVGSGGLISFPGLANIIGGSASSSITAGPGAVLDLSSVQYIQGPSGGALNVYADAGALVNLSGVTNITGNAGVYFYATSTNCVINLTSLKTFAGTGTLEAEDGGRICANNLGFIEGNVPVLADGPESEVNFSGDQQLVLGSGSSFQFTAQNGGFLNFDELKSISGSGASFLANGAGSVIDLSSLSAFTTPLSTSSLTAENGGEILLNCNVLLLQNVAVNWAGCATLPPHIPASSSYVLYDQPWNSYWVEILDTRNATNQWQFYERIPATNGLQVISGRFPSWVAFQVYEFVANPPIVDLNRASGTNVEIVVYGAPPDSFEVQTTDNVQTQPIVWSPLESTGIMTNSFYIFPAFAPTNAMRFYRAQQE